MSLSPILVTGAAGFIAARFVERLGEADVPARLMEPGEELPDGAVGVYHATLRRGLVLPSAGLVIATEADVTGARVVGAKDGRRLPAKRRNQVDPLALSAGDMVVHDQHGIGKFVEMIERTISGARREYLVIEYAPGKRGAAGDRLYVPMESLGQLSRYVGGESPTLSKMGGADWQNTKRKARKAVREIATELVQLYAKRQAAPGRAFGPDTPWQHEMEDAFPFTETVDQLTAIEDVKGDMEKSAPMDRVVVGDVGYGKTEVAVRAAFKAVQDGTQVAVLVPTTLLAQQHFQTFSDRFANWPIRLAELSRFRSAKESKAAIEGIKAGTIKDSKDMARMMTESMASMGNFIVIVFFASQMLAYFGWSNLGSIIAIKGAELLDGANGVVLILGILIPARHARQDFSVPENSLLHVRRHFYKPLQKGAPPPRNSEARANFEQLLFHPGFRVDLRFPDAVQKPIFRHAKLFNYARDRPFGHVPLAQLDDADGILCEP